MARAKHSSTPDISQKEMYLTPNQDLRGVGDPYALQANFKAASLPLDPAKLPGSSIQIVGIPSPIVGKYIHLPGGTAATPGLVFASDTDTGLYWDTAGSFYVSIDGTKEVTFNSSGIAIADLTVNRLVIAGTNGQLIDDADLTYSTVSKRLTASGSVSIGVVLEVGTATDAMTAGDAVFGLDGASRLFFDQSAQSLVLYDSGGNGDLNLNVAGNSWYNGTGNFGFGSISPTAQVHITEGTDPQLRLGYLDAAYAQLNFDGQLKVSIASGQGNEMTFAGSDSGVNYMFQVRNDDNASTNSDASVQIQVGGTSAGAPYMVFDILGGTSWIVGNDNADSDIFKIVTDTGGGFNGNDGLTIDSNGIYVYNTYTNSSNYERGVFRWASNVLEIGTEETGTGSTRDVYFIIRQQATSARWYFRYGSHAVWSVGPGDIRPEAGDSYDLGTSTFKIRDLWLQSTIFVGSSTGSEADSSTGIRLSNARYISGRNATDAGDIGIIGVNSSNAIVIGPALTGSPTEVVPGADDTISLGSSSAKWSAGYFDLANVGTATDAAASGDLAAGLTGASRLFWDQSAALLALYNSTTATNLYASGGFLGINTSGPDRRLDILDSSAAQLRLTHTDGTVYSELGADSAGVLSITSTGNVLDLVNSTSSQLCRIYGTFTNSTNYERLSVGYNPEGIGAAFGIVSRSAGTGTSRQLSIGTVGSSIVQFFTNNANRWAIQSAGHLVCNTDNSLDVGNSGSVRPRTGYFATSVVVGTSIHTITATGVVFNETGIDQDFRIEADDESYCFMVEATLNNIVMCANAEPGFNSMDGGIFLADANVVPTGNPTGGGYLYSEGGALKWRGSGGTTTTIGPS